MKAANCALLALLIGLNGCGSPASNTRSTSTSASASETLGRSEAGFERYGPFTFLGNYRITHEWLDTDPGRGGESGCSYVWAGYTEDKHGKRIPTKKGLDMWEEDGVLYQPPSPSRRDIETKSDMTRFVIGKYRPNAPGGPAYAHEHLCRTYFEPLANEYELWLKKTNLEAMRKLDEENVAKRWRYAKLLQPIAYEPATFAGLPAERVTWVYAFAPKGLEDKPVAVVTQEVRVAIGDTGYVYQLAFTLADSITQNEPEKAARRRAYWQRIQGSFRIEALR